MIYRCCTCNSSFEEGEVIPGDECEVCRDGFIEMYETELRDTDR